MSGFNISIPESEMHKLERDLKAYAKRKDEGIWRAMVKTASNIRNDARREAPYVRGKGGALQKSISMMPDKNRFEVLVMAGGTQDSGYAPFVNYGTGNKVFNGYPFRQEDREYARKFMRGPGRNKAADPYFSRAVDENYPKYIEDVRIIMAKA